MAELEGLPSLEDPVLVAAFEGWNDAADAASSALTHLARSWSAQPLVSLDPDDYYDFQVNRPTVSVRDGERVLTWPTTHLEVVRPPAAPRDLVLVRGIEPNMRWRQFCAELRGLADELGVSLVVTLGALLADAPHTRPVPVTASSADRRLADRLGLEPPRYEGPTGIVGVFEDSCRHAGMATASVWAAVPHYVAQPPCPKATLALLRRLEDVLGVAIPHGDLPEEARAWERGVEDLASDDSEVADYVRSLEEAQDAADLPEATGEAIARDFERYLRRHNRGGGPSGEGR